MPKPNSLKQLDENRREIASRVRELRRTRRWTQAELAEQLQMSQSRLSDIERGAGSFTAEQFLLLLKIFNVAVGDFIRAPGAPGAPDLRIQNALARLGAPHLQAGANALHSEQIEDVHDVVREALVDGSPRIISALAPVLTLNAHRLNLPKLYSDLERIGMEHRLAWVVENTLVAMDLFHAESGSKLREWTRLDRVAEVVMQHFLNIIPAPDRGSGAPVPPQILDGTIRSSRTLREVQASASEISKRWGIITALQPQDFLQALRAARAGH
jgi:transcriptional regulator with XRE-family HTH domain